MSLRLLEPLFTEIHSVADETVTAAQSSADPYDRLKMKTIVEIYLKKKGC